MMKKCTCGQELPDEAKFCFICGAKLPDETAAAAESSETEKFCQEAEANYAAGNNYYNGANGVAQDYAEAAKWYRKAADQGYAEAQCMLGNMYYDGWGVPQSDTEAAQWYRKAADQGNASAQCILGNM